jgi:hypothetical protein
VRIVWLGPAVGRLRLLAALAAVALSGLGHRRIVDPAVAPPAAESSPALAAIAAALP